MGYRLWWGLGCGGVGCRVRGLGLSSKAIRHEHKISWAFAEDLHPITVCVNDLYQATQAVDAQIGMLTVVFCDLDLQKEYGNIMHRYKTQMFLGRYRTPCLGISY
ncbi:hypothetical protein B0H14DRAFT_2565332 [Mycena olivaceomarginata]|nr:hypothetical protein B0H14DRAFT_2565332 [Mycena olivaceomarginata]